MTTGRSAVWPLKGPSLCSLPLSIASTSADRHDNNVNINNNEAENVLPSGLVASPPPTRAKVRMVFGPDWYPAVCGRGKTTSVHDHKAFS